MPAKIWQLMPKIEASPLGEELNLSPIIIQLLANRGLKESEEIKAFLSGQLSADKTLAIGGQAALTFYDPFLFQDMEESAALIISHIKAGHKILVYGDYDADGVTASVVILEVLQTLKAVAEVYLPDRVSEGYGLNQAAVSQAADQGFKLIITVDNGIRNQTEVSYAKSLGLDVIVTDHHVFPEDEAAWPDCLIINPAHPTDKYPWKYLAGVGVAFKLASALVHRSNLEDSQKGVILERVLDLVAVGTVADMVNILGENRYLVKAGLKVLNRRRRLGLNELLKAAKLSEDQIIEAWNIGWQLGPRLNAASRLSHANSAFSLLTTKDAAEASHLAQELNQRNLERQEITAQIISQVEEQIDKDKLPPLIIGLAGPDQIWNEGVIGLVAGRITEKYYRPTLIISRLIEEAEFDKDSGQLAPKKLTFKGSGRSIESFNLIKAVSASADYLEKYGGHFMACGFSLSGEENLSKFMAQLQQIAAQELDQNALIPRLKLEAELPLRDIDLALVEAVADLGPFGQNNQPPNFAAYNLFISDIVTMGFDSQHVKFRLVEADKPGAKAIWAIAFGGAARHQDLKIGDRIDLAYSLSINDFNGRREPQLKVIDIKKSV